ncbi:uncharacterized protein PGTG_11966 [Puccinia graminis f. sp. tritici CRL 75-36-700-3]|uniref:Uncharacterized protein n=1 Tax=Puccinia graminis f. sp. tritici (strain CRL 75-36-700-3 / race SCCL) TaxID=418459 RepID=E3KNY5_PUCGT|nr:uncharacterized protein PGTG_11966 [Puccinia graminis f. sp. tritici CRL 75-36-700-3]EFP86010.2 hypothetical protein PGTG_11966 [Puccinia graminis f. sp. tritici CRL 75-36-700-3]
MERHRHTYQAKASVKTIWKTLVQTKPPAILGPRQECFARCHAQLVRRRFTASLAYPPKNATHDDQLDDWEDTNSDTTEASLNFQDTTLLHIQKAVPNTNFVSLVMCTNIISRKSTSHADLEKFLQAYSLYTESSKLVFDSPKIVPNHHYALHTPDQMKWWGPLSNVSEFSGKKFNGLLQKMKTNAIIGQIEGTVLCEFCQMQRLNAQASSWSLQPDNKLEPKPKRMVEVHPDLYSALLQKLQSKDAAL